MTVRDVVMDAVVEVCGTDPASITDDATLTSLEIDSLDLIEVGMIVEQRFGAIVNLEDFDDVATFGAAVSVFERACPNA
jgi:acyl carrier protein